VRAAHVLERAGIRRQIVERDPAGDHLGRHEVVRVRPVLVEADRLRARRLPEDVVLEQPHAAVAGELRGEPPGPLREHLCRDHVVGPPAVADLPRAVLRVAPRHPVHLVGLDPRLVVPVEEMEEPFAQHRQRVRGHEPFLDDQEAVPVERGDLLGRQRLDHDRGRVFSGS
jgi:hypothetical protein